jgi:branched-chain amino acid transport system permease protein
MKISKRNRTNLGNYLTYGFVVAAYVVLQLMASGGKMSSSLKGMLVPLCAYVVMAISLNLVVGVSGELSLGHAGFMSVGSFTGVAAAIILQDVIPSPGARLALAMLTGAVFAAFVGFLIGIPVLRLRGDYLAIVTLAFGEIIKSIFNNLYLGMDANGLHISMLENKTNLLPDGKLIIGGPMGIGGIKKISSFTGGFVLVMICLFVIFNLVNSRSGRAIMASRDNRIAAESVGINVTKYKMMAFVTAAVLAGMAGALYGLNSSTVVPTQFTFNQSINVLVFVVLGGLGNVLGSVISATLLTVLPEVLRAFSDYRMLAYAVVLILVMIFTNNPTIRAFTNRLFGPVRKIARKPGKLLAENTNALAGVLGAAIGGAVGGSMNSLLMGIVYGAAGGIVIIALGSLLKGMSRKNEGEGQAHE